MFRFILVKYADRGLVVGGEISKLFRRLYLTVATTLHCFCATFVPVGHIKQIVQGTEPAFISVCMNHKINHEDENTWKATTIMIGTLLPAFVSLWILYFSSKRYVSKRSKSKDQPSAMIGRYQRNIVTFKQTVLIFTIFVATSLTSMRLTTLTLNVKWHFIMIFVVFVIVVFIFYKKTMSKNINNDREISKTAEFYVHEPDIVPRRDNLILTENTRRYFRSNVIYVKPAHD